jgi:hypothetical protein
LTFEPLTLELHWGLVAQTAMRTLFVILPAIHGEHDPCLGHGLKDVHIQTFVAHGTIEAFTVPILPGAAGVAIYNVRI